MTRDELEDQEPSVKLFAYAGRENGLMVVGTSDALRKFVNAMQAGLDHVARQPTTDDWPAQVASASVVLGPYQESRHLILSVHVEGAVPAEDAVPLRRSSQPVWLALAIPALAIVGIFSVVRWVISWF